MASALLPRSAAAAAAALQIRVVSYNVLSANLAQPHRYPRCSDSTCLRDKTRFQVPLAAYQRALSLCSTSVHWPASIIIQNRPIAAVPLPSHHGQSPFQISLVTLGRFQR